MNLKLKFKNKTSRFPRDVIPQIFDPYPTNVNTRISPNMRLVSYFKLKNHASRN
jgi:hypothetical protein